MVSVDSVGWEGHHYSRNAVRGPPWPICRSRLISCVLRAIVSEGSFKKAADSLYVTQPAVSLQIQNLEKQLEVSLFDRGGRKRLLRPATCC